MRKHFFKLTVLMVIFGLIPGLPTTLCLDRNTGHPWTIEEARQLSNEEIYSIDTRNFSKEYYRPGILLIPWKKYSIFAYEEINIPGNNIKNGKSRYVGITTDGEPYPNPDYEPDSYPTVQINTYDWVQEPWNKAICLKNNFNANPDLKDSYNKKIRQGLQENYGDKFYVGDFRDWTQYVHIVQPPTTYVAGRGRMWHLWDSDGDSAKEAWYVTMPLAPDVKVALVIPPPLPEEPETLPCYQGSSISNNWEELYTWEVTHSNTTTDPLTGETTTDYWTETKWAVPVYRETLSAELMVNTKQGIKNGGRESRGAWEIIPWSASQGLNPNEVTRSGYGFEVKVCTYYTNDWETQVPYGANSKGGLFYGPTEVNVDFFDTYGQFVKKVPMVPTAGKSGDKNITWELPADSHTFSDGKVISERKHYTDVSIPNGNYSVRVTITGAGKTDLCLVQRKNITIYKDMWEDNYTRPSTKDE